MAVVWRLLGRAARELSPDVIVFHSSTLAWPAIAAARRSGARSVFVVQALIRDRIDQGANPYGRATTAIYRASNAHALRHSDRVACVSEHMASVARAEGAAPQSIRVVPNPIDLSRFAAGAHAEGENAGRDIDVLFVGRLSREKGVDVLLEAMRSVPGAPGWSSPATARSRPSSSGRPRRRGSRPSSWDGSTPDALPALVARAHVQVVPSRSEPQGVVVIEALAAGTPVIGARVGGIPEMVSDGETGWLVAPNDPAALRAAISEALTDRERVAAMRERARRSAERFSVDRSARGARGGLPRRPPGRLDVVHRRYLPRSTASVGRPRGSAVPDPLTGRPTIGSIAQTPQSPLRIWSVRRETSVGARSRFLE